MNIIEELATQLKAISNILAKISSEKQEDTEVDNSKRLFKKYDNPEDKEEALPMRSVLREDEELKKENRKKGLKALMLSKKTKKDLNLE